MVDAIIQTVVDTRLVETVAKRDEKDTFGTEGVVDQRIVLEHFVDVNSSYA